MNPLTQSIDYYKFTMSQVALERHPDIRVTFQLKNRGDNSLLKFAPADQVQEVLDEISKQRFLESELAHLKQIVGVNKEHFFTKEYIEFLRRMTLPDVKVKDQFGDLNVTTTGAWPVVTFWETIVMSVVNEIYFMNMMNSLPEDEQFAYMQTAKEKLDSKIELLNTVPEMQIIEFGTRRRFNSLIQEYVVERLKEETTNLYGTSNVYLARKHKLVLVGTYAHEMPMVYAGMCEDPEAKRNSHNFMLQDWAARYGQSSSIALTDTFGSNFFFNDFTEEQAHQWNGLRHDSGDPFVFGERAKQFYEKYGIDTTTKILVFSDGLNIPKAIEIYNRFKDDFQLLFGIGTNLTNDVGVKPLDIVMKAIATHTQWGTQLNVKLSDEEGKHTGPGSEIRRYKEIFGYAPLS